jgi:dTMP kinase
LIKEFDKMAEEFHFEVIDARKSPDEIQAELRSKIQPLLTPYLRSQELPSDHVTQPAPAP